MNLRSDTAKAWNRDSYFCQPAAKTSRLLSPIFG